jgi:hypothetical protein
VDGLIAEKITKNTNKRYSALIRRGPRFEMLDRAIFMGLLAGPGRWFPFPLLDGDGTASGSAAMSRSSTLSIGILLISPSPLAARA